MIISAIWMTPMLFKYQLQTEKQEHPDQHLKNIFRALRTVYIERRLQIKRILRKKIELTEMRPTS